MKRGEIVKPRIKLKSKSKKSKLKIFILTIIGIILFTMLSLYKISNSIWPILVKYAKSEAETIVTEIINQAVQKKIPEMMNMDELFITNKDDSGVITMIDFNTVTINKILQMTNSIIQTNLYALENSDIEQLKESGISLDSALFQKIGNGRISLIPIGIVTKNALLSNLGPSIPVKINFIGNVTSNVVSKMTDYGINSVMVSVFIKVNISAEIILPLSLEKITIITEIPLSIKMIQGKVPNYYQNGYKDNSSLLSIPIEE